MKGLYKGDLIAKRAFLVRHIADLKSQEKEASALLHQAKSDKARLTKELIKAQNFLIHLDQMIAECRDIIVEELIPKTESINLG